MAIEVFNRYEHKYLLTREQYKKALEYMDEHMELDKYNFDHKPYTIANIYFDTVDDYLIRTSLSKPAYKEKLRLRSYGVPSEDSKVFLEIKKKFNGIVNKRRTVLGLDEAYSFITTKEKPELKKYMNEQVMNEISYMMTCYTVFPKVYLAYDRVAYFEKNNADLRISFDQNIRSRRYDLALEMGDYGEPILDGDYVLMEIKTSLAKPIWLTHMIAELNLRRSSFSKYGTEFTKYIHSTTKETTAEAVM